jgi:hypothetical protein
MIDEFRYNYVVTCTATLRPELLLETLVSHKENLFRNTTTSAKFIINIDCVGSEDVDSKLGDILRIINSQGFAAVSYRVANEPHFPTAFRYVMTEACQLNTPLIFHLEEDWKLLMPINFLDMIGWFYTKRRLAHLRLSQFKGEVNTMKCWNKFIEWNGDWYGIDGTLRREIGWAGHPSLNRKRWMQKVLDYIDWDHNPEKQIKGRKFGHPMNELLDEWEFGVYHPRSAPPAVEDIGRAWMTKNGYIKKGNKAWFTNWEAAQ